MTIENSKTFILSETPTTTRSATVGALAITGASGFLGSEILRQGIKSGLAVCGFARSNATVEAPFKAVDFSQPTIPDNLFSGFDQVIHTVGLAHQFGRDGENRPAFELINVEATRRAVINALAVGVRHFVLVSSVAVYGSDERLRKEDSLCQPSGPYAETKLKGEQAAIDCVKGSSMQLTILRLATLYGPGDRGNMRRLIDGLHSGRFVPFGSGSNQKTLLHVHDAAMACLNVVRRFETRTRHGQVEIYNVGAPAVSMKKVVNEIAESLEISPPRFSINESLVRGTVSLAAKLCGERGPAKRIQSTISKWLRDDLYDCSRFERDYDFKPSVSLKTGVRSQVRRFLDEQRVIPGRGWQRAFDVFLATFLLLVFAIPMMAVALAVRLTSLGPAVYWSQRVGKNQQLFHMAKFRSMRIDTPQLATHLLGESNKWITPIGNFLRKSSLDELPQLWNILVGDMSFVGPRPALFNQYDLIAMRKVRGVDGLRPGVTGWAQVNGRDELSLAEKVEFDRQYLLRRTLAFDLKILALTGLKVLRREGIRQADQIGGSKPITILQNDGKLLVVSIDSTLAACATAIETFPPSIGRMICLANLHDQNCNLKAIKAYFEKGHRFCLIVLREEIDRQEKLEELEIFSPSYPGKVIRLDHLDAAENHYVASRIAGESRLIADLIQHSNVFIDKTLLPTVSR